MPDDLPVEDAASFWVNPYTALGILDTAKSCGSKVLVHTAGASQLGQMMNKLVRGPESDGGVGGGYAGMQIINVVRREEQVKILEALGAIMVGRPVCLRVFGIFPDEKRGAL